MSRRVDSLLKAPWPAVAPIVPDARLGYRPNPAYPGHDSKGFRNLEVPAKAYLVALGDSQTYGTGVDPEDAWPRQLQSIIGKTVYSMAFGGYGPVHSLLLWDEAIALSPKIVIEAFYAGNDLFDSFNHVYNQGQLPELKTPDPKSQADIRKAEQHESIKKHVTQMFSCWGTTSTAEEKEAAVTSGGFSPRRLLSEHSKLYGLMRRAEYEIWLRKRGETPQKQWETAKAFANIHPAHCEIFSDAKFRTIFTSEYRLSVLNLEDPRIAEGLQITLRAMKRMQGFAVATNTRFIVLLIPTKERVFQQLWQTPSISYRDLVANEEQTWRITKDFLACNDIEYLDALPALRKELAAGLQPYKVSSDGHPNEYGHKAIANLVAAFLKS